MNRPIQALFAIFLLIAASAKAQESYFHRSFFDNSQTRDREFYSSGSASAPSKLETQEGKLPVETNRFLSAPNSIRLQWTSDPAGGWEAELRLYDWRNRDVFFSGSTLHFWCSTSSPMRAQDLPHLALKDTDEDFTEPIALAPFAPVYVKAGEWIHIEIPIAKFSDASVKRFDPQHVNTVIFIQGVADKQAHTLFVDEVRIDSATAQIPRTLPQPPQDVQARGYERHIAVTWSDREDPRTDHYAVYRSIAGGPFTQVGIMVPGIHRFSDYVGQPGMRAVYKVKAVNRRFADSAFSQEAAASTHPMTDDELLTMVEEASFRYCWEFAHPASGMLRENLLESSEIVATGATGFGLMNMLVGVERRFISRSQAVERFLKITAYLERADRFHGAWPHFTDGRSGQRLPLFGIFDNGADLVETSFLVQGLIAARHYFDSADLREQQLRQRITKLCEAVEWNWFRRTPDGDALIWHWSPEYSWRINNRLTGWSEVLITYLLAISSPTHGVPGSLYYTGWAGQSDSAIQYRQSWGQTQQGDRYLNGGTYDGIKLTVGVGSGGPLFFTHYSFLGLNPHGLRDRFTDYFENNRAIASINRAYCIRNPNHFKGYGKDVWGITAVDGPNGYSAYEPNEKLDDGTIAPTGAVTSYPYLPDESIQAIRYYYRVLGDRLWGVYGFHDAFNLQQNWFSRISMAINQAPMAVMIENGRTGLVWNHFMADRGVQSALARIGFQYRSPASK